jgi:hypothetical protein
VDPGLDGLTCSKHVLEGRKLHGSLKKSTVDAWRYGMITTTLEAHNSWIIHEVARIISE